MLVNHNTIELYGKKLFEIAHLTSPFKVASPLSNEACFLHVLDGVHNHYSEDSHITVQSDGGVLMKCGNYIFEPVQRENSGPTKLIAIHFYPEVLTKLFANNPPKFLLENKIEIKENMAPVKSNEIISQYINSILLLFENPSLIEESILEVKLKEIIFLLSKIDSKAIQEILHNLFNPTHVFFHNVIESHLFSLLSIEDLAHLTNNSLTSFKRKFKDFYKSSPAVYIKAKRLEKAVDLLKYSDQSISDISFNCAFNDIAYFSNSFKQKYGSTPSNFRLDEKPKS